ncbi:MAG: hypothetical protein Q8O93_02355 [bacterium]|nr:hypothetical protein [bacterium]
MEKNISKILTRTSLIILAITISGLLNICLFVLSAKAAPMPEPAVNFATGNGDTCAAEPMPEPTQTINRPSAPMPECCLTQSHNFEAVVNTANDKTAPTFANAAIFISEIANPENNFSFNTSRNIYPPPAALALSSTIIRE